MSDQTDRGYNEDLRAALEAYRMQGRDGKPLTMHELGQELGVSGSYVNKYLRLNASADRTPFGDVASLENSIADLLKSAARRKVTDVTPFSTNVVDSMHALFEGVRRTNDIGLATGPAGIGKTVSVQTYVQAYGTTLDITAAQWKRGAKSLTSMLFDRMHTKDWKGNTNRMEWMRERLCNSNRLIIVDQAHRLNRGGLEWLFDLHDATGCPIAMVGNPEILDVIDKNDQQYSRIGMHSQISLGKSRIRSYAQHMITALVKKPQDGLLDLAAVVAEQRGHLRALRKELLLMLELVDDQQFAGDQVKAFRAAHEKLVRKYRL